MPELPFICVSKKTIHLPLALWFAFCGSCLAATAAPPDLPDPRQLPASITNSIFYQRWLWHEQDRRLPDGRVPHRAHERALQQIKTAQEQSPYILETPVPGNAWLPIGPAPILNGQTSGAQPVSGRIGDIAVNPSNYNHWVIGTAQGGLWDTFNAGQTWKARTDDQASLAFAKPPDEAESNRVIPLSSIVKFQLNFRGLRD